MKKYAFTIEWQRGSINDNIIKFLKTHDINFHYNCFFQLVADMYGAGKYFTFDYEKINGDIYGIILKEAIC
ncbi:MAG: hypothetical protein II304_07490 [Bacteroidales bacterium]|nr:hypothetical protein [Bacteroidales bacterium]